MIDARRGVLYPDRIPRFHRLPPIPEAQHLVAWFWIPEWDLEPGATSRQDVVAYPALNLVVEPSGVQLVGATTAATHRDLTGRGWAVGALLRPAAVAALICSWFCQVGRVKRRRAGCLAALRRSRGGCVGMRRVW